MKFSFPKVKVKTPKIKTPKIAGRNREAEIFGVENSGIRLQSQWDEEDHAIFRRFNNREVNQKAGRIKPLNASFVREYVPSREGEFSFLLLNGNCQGVDVVMAVVEVLTQAGTEPTEIILSSLSLNADTFEKLDTLPIRKQLLISSYFLATNPKNIVGRFHRDGKLKNYDIGLWRNHTKQGCIIGDGYSIFFHGSANLRSAGDINTMAIHRDKKLCEFNKKWMQHLIQREPIEKYLATGKSNTNGFFTFLDQDKVKLFDNGND